MASGPITSWQIDGETMEILRDFIIYLFIFLAPKSLQMVTAAMKLKGVCSLEEKLWQTCCCCLVASVVSDSVRPHRRQPTRLPRPWDSRGKNTGVGCISFSNAGKWKVKEKSLSHVRLLVTPWTAAYQALPSMGFFRQEYWNGVPLPSPLEGIKTSISSPSHCLVCTYFF